MLYPAELPGPKPPEAGWTNALRAGKAFSMNFRAAHRRRKRFWRFAVRTCTGLALAAQALAFSLPAMAGCGAASGTVQIAGVDERLDVVLSDGRIVRFGGLEAPGGDVEAARQAREFLGARLTGRSAELDLIARETDRWGRVVADLLLPVDSGPPEESAAAALLARGYARVRPEFETRDCANERLAIEDEARRAGLGIWRDPDYAVIPSSDLAKLLQHDGQFVVIEGRVRRVGFGRSRLYLDLVPRGGPTIVISRKLEPAFARLGHPVGVLAGQMIRARGALDDRLGPRLEVSEPAMIEFARRSDAQGADKPRP